jgi:hypothetical protein
MTMATRYSIFGAKIETTPGTAETLLAADGAWNIMEAEMNANIDVSVRPIQGTFRKLPGVAGARGATCTFSLEVIGTGAGGVPAWATTFLAACGIVNSAGVLTPRNENPGTNVKTLTLGLWEMDGTGQRLKTMVGCMGNVTFEITPGETVRMNFTFTGVWSGVTNTSVISPTYPTLLPLRAASGAFTINSIAQTFGACTFDVGNTVVLRPSIATVSGFSHAIITDRTPTFTFDPEARLVAAEDVYGEWIASTTRALSCQFQNATDRVTIAAPAVQRMTIANGDRDGIRTDNQTLQCCRDGANAEFSITFAAP